MAFQANASSGNMHAGHGQELPSTGNQRSHRADRSRAVTPSRLGSLVTFFFANLTRFSSKVERNYGNNTLGSDVMNIDTMKRKLKNLLREVDPDYDLGHNPTLVRLVERIIFICNDTFPQIRTLQQEVLDNTRKYSEEITDLKRAKEAREKEIAKLKKENRTHLDTIKEQGKTIADQQATIEELKKVTEEVTNLRESLEKAQTDRESEAKALTQKIEALNQRIVQQETLQKQSDETISREREKQDRQREKQEAEILSLRGLIANLSLEITQLKETGPPPLRLDGYFSAPPVQ